MVMKIKSFIPSVKWVYIVCAAVIIAVFIVLYVFGIRSVVKDDVTFVVARGDTVSGVAERLIDKNLIDSLNLFKIAVRGNGGEIQSGQYDIPRGTSVWRIANMFAHGDVAATTIVVPEGLTVKQIKELLLADDDLTGDMWNVVRGLMRRCVICTMGICSRIRIVLHGELRVWHCWI